jgi:SagB-type dehydrogenase family enzyme
MKRRWLVPVFCSIVLAGECLPAQTNLVLLPGPRRGGGISVEGALAARRSVRSYTSQPLTVADVGQLLWAAQGVTSADGKRTAPSAMHRYPLEIAVVARNVDGLPCGAYRYLPAKHALEMIASATSGGTDLLTSASPQPQVGKAPAVFIIAAVYERMGAGAGNRTWTDYEAGLASENLLLEAVSLDLGAVVTGGIDAERVRNAVKLAGNEQVLVVIPVGHPTR